MGDDVLGFMHGWIVEFAKCGDEVTVICLEEREHHLSDNVTVFSLGKEYGTSRVVRILRFVRYIVQKRNSYDAVFVHMNPEYMILGGIFWRLCGISAGLWYNHRRGGLRARIAIALARRVFHTSPFAYAARFKKAQSMPAGIDTEQFKPAASAHSQMPVRILSLGRFSPVKELHIIVEALKLLAARGIQAAADFYGEPTERDRTYALKLKTLAEPLRQKKLLRFLPGVPNARAAAVYREHGIFVNATPRGSFDKTVLEAMACKIPVVVCNESFHRLVPDELFFTEGDSHSLADTLARVLALPAQSRAELGARLRDAVVREQSLRLLVPKILTALA